MMENKKGLLDLMTDLMEASRIAAQAELAVKKVMAELIPTEIRGRKRYWHDVIKIRRRVEDALRKTASEAEILAIAVLLGVKTE